MKIKFIQRQLIDIIKDKLGPDAGLLTSGGYGGYSEFGGVLNTRCTSQYMYPQSCEDSLATENRGLYFSKTNQFGEGECEHLNHLGTANFMAFYTAFSGGQAIYPKMAKDFLTTATGYGLSMNTIGFWCGSELLKDIDINAQLTDRKALMQASGLPGAEVTLNLYSFHQCSLLFNNLDDLKLEPSDMKDFYFKLTDVELAFVYTNGKLPLSVDPTSLLPSDARPTEKETAKAVAGARAVALAAGWGYLGFDISSVKLFHQALGLANVMGQTSKLYEDYHPFPNWYFGANGEGVQLGMIGLRGEKAPRVWPHHDELIRCLITLNSSNSKDFVSNPIVQQGLDNINKFFRTMFENGSDGLMLSMADGQMAPSHKTELDSKFFENKGNYDSKEALTIAVNQILLDPQFDDSRNTLLGFIKTQCPYGVACIMLESEVDMGLESYGANPGPVRADQQELHGGITDDDEQNQV
jgi:hypothetical protein